MTAYPVGAFFLTRISGPVGYGIALAQALAGDASRWTHAGVVLDADGAILEAEPGGARIAHLHEYAGQPLLISDTPVRLDVAEYVTRWGSGVTDPQALAAAYEKSVRLDVVVEAKRLVGTAYSAADYLALAALHLHLPSRWIRQRVESSGHLICSALVDRVYMNAGIHLFLDGRLPGDVMPADLAAYAEDYAARGAS